jgi:oligosaccharide repeat unit polymerase
MQTAAIVSLLIAFSVVAEASLRKTDFFSPFRIYLFFHALTFGIANLAFAKAMTPFQPLTNMVYFGSGACYLAGTLCVALAHSLLSAERGHPQTATPVLDKDDYNWRWHFAFSLALFCVFLTGMFIARYGVGAFPLLAHDKLKVLKRFLGYHWTSSIPINLASLVMALFFMGAIMKRQIWKRMNWGKWMLFATIAIFALTMSRSSLIFFAFFGIVFYHIAVRHVSIAKLGGIFILLFTVFLSIAYYKLDSISKSNQMLHQTKEKAAKALLMIPYVYVANNFWNLDYGLNAPNYRERHPTTWGFTTVSGFYDMLYTGSFWGQDYRTSTGYEDIFHEKTQKVHSLNTVTYQWGLYKDFGMVGVLLFPFGFGVLFSLLYWKMRQAPTVMNIGLYAFLSYFVGFSWFLAFWESQIYFWGLVYFTSVLAFCRMTRPPRGRLIAANGSPALAVVP